MKLYAKIYCEEGVVRERKFETEAEARAYVQAFYDTRDALDSEDDFHEASVDDEPTEDSP